MQRTFLIFLSVFGLAADVDVSEATFRWCSMRPEVACDGPRDCCCPKGEPDAVSARRPAPARRDIEAFRYHAELA